MWNRSQEANDDYAQISFYKKCILHHKLNTHMGFRCVELSKYILAIEKWTMTEMIWEIPSVSFSPESGGSVNPRRAMEEMSTQGTIRLKK